MACKVQIPLAVADIIEHGKRRPTVGSTKGKEGLRQAGRQGVNIYCAPTMFLVVGWW